MFKKGKKSKQPLSPEVEMLDLCFLIKVEGGWKRNVYQFLELDFYEMY